MGKRNGFTLVELVVVVLILGILAAIAAPKILNNSDDATDSAASQTLATIRDAIELYRAQNNGTLPPSGSEAAFTSALDPLLRGSNFPKCPVGAMDNEVNIVAVAGALAADGSPTKGWKYSSTTGEFIINSGANMASDASVQYDDL